MSKTSLLLKASALLLAMVASSAAMAGNCAATKAKEAAVYGSTADRCANLTKVADITKNPYVYISPNGGCDLGLSLPGLPNYGNGGSLTACEVARAITGPMVAEANGAMRAGADAALNAAPEATKAALDAYNNYQKSGGDLGSMVDKTYGQMGSPTPSINPSTGKVACPSGWICE
jgi:hypothetical protein